MARNIGLFLAQDENLDFEVDGVAIAPIDVDRRADEIVRIGAADIRTGFVVGVEESVVRIGGAKQRRFDMESNRQLDLPS